MHGDPELEIFDDPGGASERAAALVLSALRSALDERGRFDLALTGGSSPVRLYELLTQAEADWTGAHLWLGDERCVPPDDEESNVRLARQHLGAPGSVMHLPPGSGTAEERAAAYAAQLKDRTLDLVLLGLGEDGHMASLFPDHPGLDDERVVIPVHDSPKPPPDRISLGRHVITGARQRIVLAFGEGKAAALDDALGDPSRSTPTSLLPGDGTTVLADRAARPD